MSIEWLLLACWLLLPLIVRYGRLVLCPLSHITLNWELTWDHEAQTYEIEEDCFAAILNQTILDLAESEPPARFHDNEDRLAQLVIEKLGWPVRKEPSGHTFPAPLLPAAIEAVRMIRERSVTTAQASRDLDVCERAA